MKYIGILRNHGVVFDDDTALAYAAGCCGIAISDENAPDFAEWKKDFLEWFYSGNWVTEES